ncbi:hypothetical protein ACGYK5_17915 [Sulfitobacter sp. 1A16787]|uniref:hypothetical protein n=1 Tax=Sulfitobacter sp. 1A16787 TaxID=3368571 RepID=UPI00374760E3
MKYVMPIALIGFLTACSTPVDVDNSPVLATVASQGDIASATHCVRKRKEAEGTMVNSVMSFDYFPTPTGMDMHLYAQGDHRITYAIAYFTETSSGYTATVKATGKVWGNELVKWVKSCAI